MSRKRLMDRLRRTRRLMWVWMTASALALPGCLQTPLPPPAAGQASHAPSAVEKGAPSSVVQANWLQQSASGVTQAAHLFAPPPVPSTDAERLPVTPQASGETPKLPTIRLAPECPVNGLNGPPPVESEEKSNATAPESSQSNQHAATTEQEHGPLIPPTPPEGEEPLSQRDASPSQPDSEDPIPLPPPVLEPEESHDSTAGPSMPELPKATELEPASPEGHEEPRDGENHTLAPEILTPVENPDGPSESAQSPATLDPLDLSDSTNARPVTQPSVERAESPGTTPWGALRRLPPVQPTVLESGSKAADESRLRRLPPVEDVELQRPAAAADNESLRRLPPVEQPAGRDPGTDQSLLPPAASRSWPGGAELESSQAADPSTTEAPSKLDLDIADVPVDPLPVEPPVVNSSEMDQDRGSAFPIGNLAKGEPAMEPRDGRPVEGPDPIESTMPAPTRQLLTPAATALLNRQLDAITHRAEELASRGAFFAARAEMIKALRAVTQVVDTEQRERRHSQALARAMRAMREAEDFAPKGSQLEAELNLTSLVASHRTPVLKETQLDRMTPLMAQQQYFTFAQQQFAEACDGLTVASRALYGLGRLYTEMKHSSFGASTLDVPRAVTLYQAALIVDPNNSTAANELGVILAKCGRLEDARRVLLHGLSVHASPVLWRNLAVVHQRLGDARLAERAMRQSRMAANTRNDSAKTADVQPVRWVDARQFTAARPASGP